MINAKTPQSKILIDSNVYLRLAQSIHPFLSQEFGAQRYCLYIIDGFEKEYFKSPRLRSRFSWVQQQEYADNRTHEIRRSKKENQEVNFNLEYLKDAATDLDLSTSLIDIEALSLAVVLSIPIVTDDTDMLLLAKEYDIKTMKTLELMKLMKDEGHIDDNKINSITAFWNYSRDFPKNFKSDFKVIFGREPKK